MRKLSPRKLAVIGVAVAALAGLWHVFAPSALGGMTTYLVTDGVSMEPLLHAGDLALIRSEPSYHVGEVVAYDNTMLHTVVLHRIVGRIGSRYLFKGDNNDFIDFQHPARDQLLGALWVHLPGVGGVLREVRSPLLIGVMTALALLLFAGGAFTRRRLRRRRRRAGAQHLGLPPPRALRRRPAPLRAFDESVALALTALVPFAMLAALALARPATVPARVPLGYAQHAHFSYSASHGARTGSPLRTSPGERAVVRVAYSLTAHAPARLQGRIALRAVVHATDGTQRTLERWPARAFEGTRAAAAWPLDVAALAARASATPVVGTATVELIAEVHAAGSLARRPLHARYAPRLQFALSPLELSPRGAAAHTASGSLLVPGRRADSLSLLLLALPVALARWIAFAGMLLAGGALAWTGRRARRFAADESARINHRYRRLLVRVGAVGARPGVPVIDVPDIASLARIAEHSERMILQVVERDLETFWVADDCAQFRFTLLAPPRDGVLFDYDRDGRSTRELLAERAAPAPASGLVPQPTG